MSDQIILFGAGALGRWTLARLRSIGVEPLFFLDNNRSLWDTKIDGVWVMPPETTDLGRFPIVVTIYNGSAVRRQLADLGIKAIRFAEFAHHHPEVQLPGWTSLTETTANWQDAEYIWADKESRDEYDNQMRYRRCGVSLLSHSDPAYIYFPFDLFNPSGSEVFVDCGAYDGDTIRLFKSRWRWWDKIIAIEPDPLNFSKLQGMPGIELMMTAVGRCQEKAYFNASGTAASSLDTDGTYEAQVCRLDDILKDEDPTFIKMDVEGSELDAINGAQRILQDDEPILAVCLYHKQADLWEIPLRIKAINPSYNLFLRRYAEDCWEQVCYAIPPHRLRREVSRTVACPGAFAE